MWKRNKILLLPVLVILAGIFFLVKGENDVSFPHTMSKGNPFPPDHGTKTEYCIQKSTASVSKPYSADCNITRNIELKISVVSNVIIEEQSDFNSSSNKNPLKGRAPPRFS